MLDRYDRCPGLDFGIYNEHDNAPASPLHPYMHARRASRNRDNGQRGPSATMYMRSLYRPDKPRSGAQDTIFVPCVKRSSSVERKRNERRRIAHGVSAVSGRFYARAASAIEERDSCVTKRAERTATRRCATHFSALGIQDSRSGAVDRKFGCVYASLRQSIAVHTGRVILTQKKSFREILRG